MKKVLVIGASGFVGPYLCQNLKDNGYDVFGTKTINQEQNFIGQCFDLNILNKEEIKNVFKQINPDYIIHLAAQSSVKLSWERPSLTFEINVLGIINIFESLKEINLKPRILLVGSSEEYGNVNSILVNENEKTNPTNFYALSKLTQEKIGLIYHNSFGFDVVLARSFNHIGPNQTTQFVVSDFAKQIADIEKNPGKNALFVGNLNAKRDFSDVRDIVNAYRLLIEKGKSGELYNVGSGESISIKEILDILISLSDCEISIKIDENKLRPIDTKDVKADISKLVKDTNYSQKYNIKDTLKDVLNSFRK